MKVKEAKALKIEWSGGFAGGVCMTAVNMVCQTSTSTYEKVKSLSRRFLSEKIGRISRESGRRISRGISA